MYNLRKREQFDTVKRTLRDSRARSQVVVHWLDQTMVKAAGNGVSRGRQGLLVFSRHAGAAASGDASPLDRMDVSRSGANSQALRKGRSPGRVLHRRACRCCCCCSRYGGLLTRFSNSTFISFSRLSDCPFCLILSTIVTVVPFFDVSHSCTFCMVTTALRIFMQIHIFANTKEQNLIKTGTLLCIICVFLYIL